jgi:hypothetical protein
VAQRHHHASQLVGRDVPVVVLGVNVMGGEKMAIFFITEDNLIIINK